MIRVSHASCLLSLLALFFVLTASAETIKLGGPRQVVAEVTPVAEKGNWLVVLQMRPVECFDQAMNRKVQQRLGCNYALEALARMLKADTLSARSCKCEDMSQEKGRVTMQIRIGGACQEKDKPAASGVSSFPVQTVVATSRGLLSREADWTSTIESFQKTMQEECRLVFAHTPFGDENALRLVQCEEDMLNGHKSLKAEIGKDTALLQIERTRLLAQCDDAARSLDALLKGYGECLEVADRFQNVEIEAAFVPLLLGSPLLMEGGEARMLITPDGRRAMVSVGTAEIRNRSAKDQLRQRKVAQTRAVRQLVLWCQSHVTAKNIMTESTVVSTDGENTAVEETARYDEITTEEAEGIVKGLPVIGTWTSKDGQVFYLAIGEFL